MLSLSDEFIILWVLIDITMADMQSNIQISNSNLSGPLAYYQWSVKKIDCWNFLNKIFLKNRKQILKII